MAKARIHPLMARSGWRGAALAALLCAAPVGGCDVSPVPVPTTEQESPPGSEPETPTAGEGDFSGGGGEPSTGGVDMGAEGSDDSKAQGCGDAWSSDDADAADVGGEGHGAAEDAQGDCIEDGAPGRDR